MKRIQIVLIITAVLGLSACSDEARFSISTSQNEDMDVIYTTPLSGTFTYMSIDTVRVFAGGGKTVFRSEYEHPVPIYLRTEDGSGMYILAEAGGEYDIHIDASGLKLIGKVAQKLYNALPEPAHIIEEAQRHSDAKSAKNLIDRTKAIMDRELHPFDSLRQRAEISKAAHKHISRERDLYWRAVRGNVAYIQFSEKNELSEEDRKMWKSAFDGINLNDRSLCSKRWYYELAESYVEYCIFSSPDFNMQELLKKAAEGKINSIYYEIFTEKFKGRCLEYLSARRLYNAAMQRNFEKELVDIYSDFCERFPESEYRSILDPMMQEIVEFHEATRSNENVIILDNYLSINSFEDLLSKFQGKKLYIDVWATWCGPCKDEFRHNEKLRKLLEEAGYELLYISIDDDKRARTWEQMIYASELEGYHIRAGAELHRQLFEIYGSQRLNIPWYMTVDENGHITNDRAPRPGRLRKENLN